jgi:predicted dehydrogenase
MMKKELNRRDFVRTAAVGGIGLGLTANVTSLFGSSRVPAGKKAGIIGLDTSHSVAYTKTLNNADAGPEYGGYKVVAAYPKGSNDIKSSVDRIPGYIEEVKKLGVEIVDSIDELLKRVDVVFLETNDGRLHLEQAIPVFKAGKRMFIDKPIAASLTDAVAIFNAADYYKVPVFSSSSLRYISGAIDISGGAIGKVIGADTYSPCTIETTHPDLFWYGIHGVETLFAVMGTGCKSVTRVHTADTDLVTGTWQDGRIGTFRGTRSGKHGYGGTAFGEKGIISLGNFGGYDPLLVKVIEFFDTGIVPVRPEETLEIFAFMQAADESKLKGGASVEVEKVMQEAVKEAKKKSFK